MLMNGKKVVSGNYGMAQNPHPVFLWMGFSEPTREYREIAEWREFPALEVSPKSERCLGKMTWEVCEMAPIRVLLVDDHEVARRGIRSVLSSDANLDVVGETADGEEAVRKAKELHPAIVLMDISLPGISGIQAARQIRVVSPDSRIIFLSQHDSIQIARDALSIGAHAYVVKSDAGRDLLMAIEAANEGRTFVSRSLVQRGWS